MTEYFYDTNQVRYQLYQTNGGKPLNWLFFPGGPGADSSYFQGLVDCLDLPGNVWLIDFPGNGNNTEGVSENYDYDIWLSLFPTVVKKFQNVVLVGHSFGGMLPLLYPELEKLLKGFVILNSAPKLWLEDAVSYAKPFSLPDLTSEMQEFTKNPNQETFNVALEACMPYYFPKETLEMGRKLLLQIPFSFKPAVWWQRKAIETNFSAKWVPETVPTMIIGAKYDCICPHTLFENDPRFQRPNIDIKFFDDVGHVGWSENPAAFKKAFLEVTALLE